MKNLLACLAILAAFNVTAQIDGFQLPYNPDSEPDGYIGVGDVLEVLAIFGSQWNASDIYLSNDSTSMTMYVGVMKYHHCLAACSGLSGHWRLATYRDFAPIFDSLPTAGVNNSYLWYYDESEEYGSYPGKYLVWYTAAGGYVYSTSNITGANDFPCYCSTHERPKVEYSICKNTVYQAPFEQCCSSKVAEGWYPLSSNPVSGGSSAEFGQAFWRWAD